MRVHRIEPGRETLHGAFYRDLPPALTIDPGDTVVFRTLDAGWNLEQPGEPGTRRCRFEDFRPEWRGDGHALCGPVEVRDAEPGMTLEVRIDELRPGAWGRTGSGGAHSELNRRLGLGDREEQLRWTLDPELRIGRDQHGHTVALRPFMGVMGIPPDEPGQHSTIPPRATGGNIDCKELVSGSSLFLPIAVPGALFSVGDGHAAQGDGEVCGQAIECPMEHVELTFRLDPDLELRTPRALTPSGWLTFGFHRDLNEAMTLALDAMLDLMGDLHGVDRYRGMALASIAVDLRVTQVVNEVWGVHAVLPHGAIR
jgi:acetamidase/formamidase